MTARRVTLADVARRAGVSRTTASFVLSGRSDMRISAAAQARVLLAAQELAYRPNLTARGLRTSVTHTIGFVSDTVATTQYAGELIQGSLEAATARDHLLFIAETGGDPAVEARVLDGMADRQVDGLVYASLYARRIVPPALPRGRRLVLLNCVAPGSDVPSVLPDDEAAGAEVARAVLAAGHRDDVYVVGGHHHTDRTPDGALAGHDRMRGVFAAFAAAGARVAGVTECAWEPDEGYRAVTALLARGGRPAALICCNDRLALGAYQALREAGLEIPGDVAVASFDDSPLASWLRPQLTSARLPHHRMGQTAVELLLGPHPADPGPHRVPMDLALRGSLPAPAQPPVLAPG
jgi:LacI family transcriptional regulator